MAGCGVFLMSFNVLPAPTDLTSHPFPAQPSCPLLQELGVGRGKYGQTDSLAEAGSPHPAKQSPPGMILKG